MKKYNILLFAIITVMFSSCYKNIDTGDLDTQDLTLTVYDKAFAESPIENFKTYKTFIIRDSVGVISDYLSEDEIQKFHSPAGNGPKIRSYIRSKFINAGYQQVDSLKDADFAVNIVLELVENTAYTMYPGWWYDWGGYWGWYGYYGYYKNANYYYDPWWGGYYPYYPSYGYTSYTYETGTVMIEMIDGKSLKEFYDFVIDKTPDEIQDMPKDSIPEIKYRWQAFLNGVLSSTDAYNNDRFERSVNEAFEQSPYIKAE